ncbi:MAG TPA: hypothetical protein VGG10_11805 [Rhizomicrobium sp.]|jgi:tetratricopeptide (TPR) repeat protein
MADEHDPAPASQAASIAMMAAGDPAMRDDVRRYLERQSELAALQIEDLKREDKVRHWSLRVHHISDVLKLCLELAAAAVVAIVAALIGGSVWAAAHDNGVVIEAFDVPADFAQRGLTGKVVAGQLLDRLEAMQAATDSARPAASYANNWGGDIKVQIPNTGVSVGEFNQYLHGWLGNQTRIAGELYRTAGGISVTTRVGDANASYQGSEADLGKLLQKSAEAIYAQTQPYRFAQFLIEHDRAPEALRVLSNLAVDGPESERGWAFGQLGLLDLNTNGDIKTARMHLQKGLGFGDGSDVLAGVGLVNAELWSGHDEMAHKYTLMVDSKSQSKGADITQGYFEGNRLVASGYLAGQVGDFRKSASDLNRLKTVSMTYSTDLTEPAATAVAYVLDHDPGAAAAEIAPSAAGDSAPRPLLYGATMGAIASTGAMDDTRFLTNDANEGWKSLPVYWIAVAYGDWRGALADAHTSDAWLAAHTSQHRVFGLMRSVLVVPLEALAMANSGDAAGAEAAIGKTPLDCYLCVRVRAQIASDKGDWKSAATWSADAARQAPSLPFADAEWGAMLLRKGDLDSAIAKFAVAHQKGPHFADPLELWGETLMLQNRSDLAIAKFEEADEYAPRWGRLHLKWGEALFYSGHRSAAAAQYRIASTLALTTTERAELARRSGTSA